MVLNFPKIINIQLFNVQPLRIVHILNFLTQFIYVKTIPLIELKKYNLQLKVLRLVLEFVQNKIYQKIFIIKILNKLDINIYFNQLLDFIYMILMDISVHMMILQQINISLDSIFQKGCSECGSKLRKINCDMKTLQASKIIYIKNLKIT